MFVFLFCQLIFFGQLVPILLFYTILHLVHGQVNTIIKIPTPECIVVRKQSSSLEKDHKDICQTVTRLSANALE